MKMNVELYGCVTDFAICPTPHPYESNDDAMMSKRKFGIIKAVSQRNARDVLKASSHSHLELKSSSYR